MSGSGAAGLDRMPGVCGTLLLLAVLGMLVLTTIPSLGSARLVSPRPASAGIVEVAAPALGVVTTVALPAAPSFPTSIQHVILILEENKEWSAVWNYGPYEVSLARSYANVSQFYGLEQASYPSYAAATSGYYATGAPRPINVSSIADLTRSAGETWTEWTESAPKACDRTNDNQVGYLDRHVPFVWYQDVYHNRSECNANVVPKTLPQMQAALSNGTTTSFPNFLLVTPNAYDDGDLYKASCAPPGVRNHTRAEVACTDGWLGALLPHLIDNTALFDHTAVLIAYDQSSTSDDSGANVGADGGHVYASVVSPDAITGYSSTTAYTAYDLLTTTEWLLGLPGGTLNNDNWTAHPPMKDLFV